MMKKLFLLLLLTTFSSLQVWAQDERGEETQIGFRFTGQKDSRTAIKGGIPGVGADAIVNLGEHVSLRGLAQVERVKLTFNPTPFHIFTADTDIRFSPATMSGIHFFAATGVNFQRYIVSSGSQNFFSPVLGGGLGYGKFGHLLYKRGFPDLSSPFGQHFHRIEGNIFAQVSSTSKWRARFGGFYQRTYLQNAPIPGGTTNWSQAGGYIGFSRVVGK